MKFSTVAPKVYEFFASDKKYFENSRRRNDNIIIVAKITIHVSKLNAVSIALPEIIILLYKHQNHFEYFL